MFTGGNLTYEIPKGIADDCFVVDSLRGIVTTKGTFDRETKDLYTVPIYVMESMTTQFKSTATSKTNKVFKSQFDVATIVIRITDVNDHAPEFRPGSCYPLTIPENSDLSIIHQVVATDLDEGPNGDITYSITGKHFASRHSHYNPMPFPHSRAPFFVLAVAAADVAINIFPH